MTAPSSLTTPLPGLEKEIPALVDVCATLSNGVPGCPELLGPHRVMRGGKDPVHSVTTQSTNPTGWLVPGTLRAASP